LVFTLSKGNDPNEAEIPDKAEATNRIEVVYLASPKYD
jgi:hypothetical protein